MKQSNSLPTGLFLIIIGLFFFIAQFVDIPIDNHWPLIIIIGGLVFLATATFGSKPDLTIPGTLLTGLGSLLYYQSLTGNWASWSYAWTLIPGFVGLGHLWHARLTTDPDQKKVGQRIILRSFILFLIFGTLFNGLLSPLVLLGLLLILAGIRLLWR
ncbi:MAG TPA: hypothetical protein VLL52_13415 [Anaerolineae bacterium]|nr:hypothetical protein [Anaerolineae bacterium]